MTGCASTAVDTTGLREGLRRDLASSPSKVSAVDCPSTSSLRAGATLACTAALPSGGSLVYDVTITSDQGDYRYALAPNQALDSQELARELTARLVADDASLASAVVTCPSSLLAPGGVVDARCSVAVNGVDVPVVVAGEPGQALTWHFAAGS